MLFFSFSVCGIKHDVGLSREFYNTHGSQNTAVKILFSLTLDESIVGLKRIFSVSLQLQGGSCKTTSHHRQLAQ
jgi:hypothetical protein